MIDSFNAQTSMFPLMINDDIRQTIDRHRDHLLGYKITGAGGGGYVVAFSEKPIDGAIRLKIRTEDQ